jgi:putative ABC transport system permease protein
MNIFEAFRVAWVAMTTHKMRALLTMLGIIIGVGAVIGMQAIGSGFSNYMAGQFNQLGAGVLYITPAVDEEQTNGFGPPGQSSITQEARLTAADAEALLDPGRAPSVAAVAVEYSSFGTVSAGLDRYYYNVKAVSPSHFAISANDLGAGRFFTDEEDRSGARVVMIGNKVAETLYGSVGAAVGQRITVNGVAFDVVGVLTTKANGASAQMGSFSDPAEEVYVPYRTGRSRLFRNQMTARVDVARVTVQATSPEAVEQAQREVTLLLRERHRLTYQPNDFTVTNVEQAAEQAQVAMAGFSMFLLVIGFISLLVGGIGIMNIMLVSVTQRTREIGLRKAVGARQRDILAQFLIESMVLSVAGGAIGIGLGYLLSFAGTAVMRSVFLVDDAQAVVTLGSVIMATTVSAAVGVIFGLFPALRASRLSPITALRTE